MSHSFDNSALRNYISQIRTLPSTCDLCTRLVELLDCEETDIDEVGALICEDTALTAKIFKLVNSDLFGHLPMIADTKQAIHTVGPDVLSALLTMSDLFAVADDELLPLVVQLQQHVAQVKQYAVAVAEQLQPGQKSLMHRASVTATLHDVGKLVLWMYDEPGYRAIQQWGANVNQQDVIDKERNCYQADHGVVGAYLLGLWGFPDYVVDAVSYHHAPSDAGETSDPQLLAVIHIAEMVALCGRADTAGSAACWDHSLDKAFMQQQGLPDDMAYWVRCIEKQE